MSAAIAKFFTDYKDAFVVIGWLLVAFGWQITNRQANSREIRKETRAEIDSICEATAEVITKCRDYFSFEPTDPADDRRSAEIAFEVKRILIRTERLYRRNLMPKITRDACGEFFDAVTAEPFQSKTRSIHGPGSSVLQKIDESVHNLIDLLEENFPKTFI